MKTEIMDAYVAILEEELILATGCTEPIAIAYAAAKLRDTLGIVPERVKAEVSGNILKNVKSVVVPGTGGMKGIAAAVAAGVVAGDANAELQVIGTVSKADLKRIKDYADTTPVEVSCMDDTPCMLDIRLTGRAGADTAVVRIANNHTNVVHVEKNGHVFFDHPVVASAEDHLQDKSVLNLAEILKFADEVPIERIEKLVGRQVEYNSAIADAGLSGKWGAAVGCTLLEFSNDIRTEARAYAAAGSDARMSGCELPVVIVSGSGNQGITASMPVVRFAKHMNVTREKLLRAVAVSDLITIHQKTGIGRLSAFCGAVSAGIGSAAGIAYLYDEPYQIVAETVTTAMGMISGTVCDGAKPSCAAKIAAAVEAGLLSYSMARKGRRFHGGDGIVTRGVEGTIRNIGILAREGMRETDKVILKIMLECEDE
ncbi:MAG: serine dehydratase subunit alpha family protein [Oscillospiraceae bacterium]|nr:serine dehydratase subunit alpha family protein [Oscillospiraceae bacterium]MBQ9046218.1 serine dehydratase subunit alpha family protein [Oscillospiraceae bacterium]